MISRIDVVYHFASLAQNHIFEVKVPADHEQPSVASISPLWSGAILQEREIYDLMGVKFPGHPELTRLFLWESFPGPSAAQRLHVHARRPKVRPQPVPEAGRRPDRPGVPARRRPAPASSSAAKEVGRPTPESMVAR